MKEILIISGKGGSGKTSLCAAFAELEKKAVLTDCDVDASNLPLLLRSRIVKRHPFFAGFFAEIHPERCAGDQAACRIPCRNGALEWQKGIPVIRQDLCDGCGVCASVCRGRAIVMRARRCGEWYESRTEESWLFHAKLRPGGENSGKLISRLRNAARETAEKNHAEILLSDGPPGIGCPVISSISGADLSVIVTEPTLSGLHDLKRVVALARHFESEIQIIINKADLNAAITSEIRSYCSAEHIALAGEIPFDPLFGRCLNQGKTILSHPDSKTAGIVRDLWQTIIQKKGR